MLQPTRSRDRDSHERGFLWILQAKYGLHSLRSGGATLAANSGVQDSLWMEHGGWKSERAARGYIKTSVASKLSVNHSMFPQYRTQPSSGTGGA
ncbi:hypothetical protein WJX75_005689 [Coccomyxa subellipsoidea]|uniref:Uncharacterized protein n=1 Tax=Coccomyxa subellipsoidea TaxID=248742 RepID=A0ABR2Z3X5_9CHLO